jgi:hypothetical protein
MASNPAQDLQEEFLSATKKSQEIVLQAIKTWVEAAQAVTPKVPNVKLPFADQLPNPADLVSGGYDFAEKVLANQRHFAEEILELTAKLVPGEGKPAK